MFAMMHPVQVNNAPVLGGSLGGTGSSGKIPFSDNPGPLLGLPRPSGSEGLPKAGTMDRPTTSLRPTGDLFFGMQPSRISWTRSGNRC